MWKGLSMRKKRHTVREKNEGIHKILEEWEEEVKQDSVKNEEMEDRRTLVPDPGNTKGKITQLKHALYLYWLMKSLLRKAMEQISVGTVVIVQDMTNYKYEFKKLWFQLHKKDIKLGRIERHIPCILEVS